MEVTGRRGRRRRKLLDDLKERRGYCHLKEEAPDRTLWRTRFGRGFGPVVRQTTEWMRSLYGKMCAVDRMWWWLHMQFWSPLLNCLVCWSAKTRTNNIKACCCWFSHTFKANAVSRLKLCNDRILLCLLQFTGHKLFCLRTPRCHSIHWDNEYIMKCKMARRKLHNSKR